MKGSQQPHCLRHIVRVIKNPSACLVWSCKLGIGDALPQLNPGNSPNKVIRKITLLPAGDIFILPFSFKAWLLRQTVMLPVIPQKQVILLFQSLSALAQFKQKCNCPDFYIERDALKLIGSFTPGQVVTAIKKYGAVSLPAAG
jgi:hypothetical protein